MLEWPRCLFVARGKHWSRGRSRIGELIAVNLVPDDEAYFKRKLKVEILYAWSGFAQDVCEICCEALNGYEDGTCVLCQHICICRACIQVIEPDNLEPNCADEISEKN